MKKSTTLLDTNGKLVRVTVDFNEATNEITSSFEPITGKEIARLGFETSNQGKKVIEVLFTEDNKLSAYEIVKRPKFKFKPYWHNYLAKGKAQFGKALDALDADFEIDLTGFDALASIDKDNPLLAPAFNNIKEKYINKINALCAAFDEKLKAGKSRQSLVDQVIERSFSILRNY